MKVSLIIPTLNAQAQLPALIDALRAQTATPQEILVVDSQSEDGTAQTARQLGCRVVHTDDFYLPLAARCANWQEQPGANIDFIRLRNEVLQPLLRGETALYNAYSCAAGAFLPSKPFAAAPLTILEGSYSLHPALQTDFAVRVFVTCPPYVQAARLRASTLSSRYSPAASRIAAVSTTYIAASDTLLPKK